MSNVVTNFQKEGNNIFNDALKCFYLVLLRLRVIQYNILYMTDLDTDITVIGYFQLHWLLVIRFPIRLSVKTQIHRYFSESHSERQKIA